MGHNEVSIHGGIPMSSLPTPPRTQLFIAGEFTDGQSTERVDITSPGSGEAIASIPVPTQADLDLAVAKAHEAKTAWRKLGVFARAAICHRVGDALEARVNELAKLQSLEQGKPLEESLADVKEAAQLFHLHAEDAMRLYGETLPSNDINKRQMTTRAPIGVFGIITPWNFPLPHVRRVRRTGPRHGQRTRRQASDEHAAHGPRGDGAAIVEAGVPAGLVSVLPGGGDFGAALVSHPGIDAVGFIGSSATATKIQATAGLKPLLIEASGNGPVVVLADANIKRAAKAAVDGAFYCAGQVCCATERVIVHRDIHEEFVAAVLEYAKETVVLGDPFDPKDEPRPLTTRASQRRWIATSQTRANEA